MKILILWVVLLFWGCEKSTEDITKESCERLRKIHAKYQKDSTADLKQDILDWIHWAKEQNMNVDPMVSFDLHKAIKKQCPELFEVKLD